MYYDKLPKVTRSFLSRISNRATASAPKPSTLLLAVVLSFVLIGGSLVWSAWQTKAIVTSLRSLNLATASAQAQQLQPLSSVIAVTAGSVVPDLKAWHQAIEITAQLSHTAEHVMTANSANLLGSSTASDEMHTTYAQVLGNLVTQIDQLNSQLAKTVALQSLFRPQLETFSELNTYLQTVYQTLLVGDHTYIVLFQNSEELRATGGFMGSYAMATVSNGLVTELDIQDIYVPDGQFTGFVTPPAGVHEYLSSGNGLRLPDANWWPDFPSSAARILPFMAMGRNQSLDGVIAINLNLVEKMLQVTGPIYLPDYQTHVTAENFAEVARSDRDEFFPGSTAKVQFLSHFMTQLKLKLGQLNPQQYQELAKVMLTSLSTKDIQVYSNQSRLQELVRQQQFSGELYAPSETFYLMNIESNVGINKANRAIARSVSLTLGERSSQVEIQFENDNPLSSPSPTPPPDTADHLHYINYHRLLVLPDVSISNIIFDDQEVTTWNEEIITTHQGQQLKQIGFLIEVPEQTQRVLEVHLQHPPLTTYTSLTLQKQSGTPPTPYLISSPQGSNSLLLEKDETLGFSELN